MDLDLDARASNDRRSHPLQRSGEHNMGTRTESGLLLTMIFFGVFNVLLTSGR